MTQVCFLYVSFDKPSQVINDTGMSICLVKLLLTLLCLYVASRMTLVYVLSQYNDVGIYIFTFYHN